jgi:hypothetical protein
MSFSRRVLTPAPGLPQAPLRAKPADATGYPLRHRLACGGTNQPMIISTLCLPETTANVRHQHVPSRKHLH